MRTDWKSTHRVRYPNGTKGEIMVLDGIGYERQEWDTESVADLELANGRWLFQGVPFAGSVQPLTPPVIPQVQG